MLDADETIHETMLKYLEANRTVFVKRLEAAGEIDFHDGVMAGPTIGTTKTTHLDTDLKDELLKHLNKLRRKIDWIGDKQLRQQLDEHATGMYNLIKHYQ